jgi:predicted alpha/beta hydrolase
VVVLSVQELAGLIIYTSEDDEFSEFYQLAKIGERDLNHKHSSVGHTKLYKFWDKITT